jgi:malonate decarboxylase epsilon subunit
MSIAFLFPGQGSQVAGMLHTLPDHPAITQTFDEVSQYLGENVLDLDSPSALQSTLSVQLTLFTCDAAMSRVLVEEGVRPAAVAGLSVGAFAAAVQSGTISLSDGVQLVRQRAEMMMKLYPKGYGLAAIVGLTERQVTALVDEVHARQIPIYIANVNAPCQIVIAGERRYQSGAACSPEKRRAEGGIPSGFRALALSTAGAGSRSLERKFADNDSAAALCDLREQREC